MRGDIVIIMTRSPIGSRLKAYGCGLNVEIIAVQVLRIAELWPIFPIGKLKRVPATGSDFRTGRRARTDVFAHCMKLGVKAKAPQRDDAVF